MSLLDTMKEKFVMLDKRSNVPDGTGGHKNIYVEGAEFEAIVNLTNSLEESVAMKQGVTGVYDVTVSRSIRLDYLDIIKRLRDGKVFRITSVDESETPSTTQLDIRKVRAEGFELPSD